MSRDPTLTLDESNLVIGKDGRVHYTFTAENDNPKVRLASKCLGTAHFNQLMIERGDKATGYVAPVVVEGSGESTGVFKSLEEMLSGLQSINLELTDTKNSKLWSKIKLTNRGMLQEYYDGTIKTEIINSAKGIATRISEETGQKLALINDTIDGIRREYQDADRRLSASYQAGIEGLKATMRDDKLDLQAEIQATAQGLSQKYDNELRQLSAKITTTSSGTTEAYENKLEGLRAEFTRSNQGMRTVLESKISGLQSTQQATANQISQEIKNREGAVSRVQQDLDSYQRRLQSAEDNYSSLQQTVRGIQSTVSAPNRGLESRVTQLAGLIEQKVTRGEMESYIRGAGDSIMLAIKGKLPQSKMSASEIVSAINLNGYGVRISGERIALDGNTTVNGAFGAKLGEFIKLKADQIIGGTIDANKINVINLNASSIVGLDANFIKAKIEYAITSLLEGKVIRARNGAMMIDLNNSTIDFNSDASINFNSNNNALVRKSGTHTAFVHFGNATPKNFTRSALYASIGITSSGDGINSASSGRFCGARFFRTASGYEHTASVDQAEIYGDTIIFADDFGINRGFKMTPTGVNTLVDINKMYYAIVALARCWKHLQNVGWDTTHPNFTSAIMNEHSNYMTGI
ncbi:gp58-like family protein [Streptococcus pyogenes]|uniref:gp58-like family protein n=1 Tax=Streptococcus pyogenes TaxID=1314 RepID=UPI0023E2D71C|nr:gp58-like family protein [Streptococcus pyogenes]WER79321.1 gp58-like family protein [Streptococcus pyogenes]WER83382.1 gp58-like family protein [Streptococcus pyogenes]WER83429.1 gp58-like family protein [Streptococcus pyogenes]